MNDNQLLKMKDIVEAVEQTVANLMADEHIPGITIGIVHDQQLIWSKGYGYADNEKRIPASVNTIYPLYSITKVFTATMLMQLCEKGLINIDDPIDNYIKDLDIKPFILDRNPEKITIRHLVSHTSGLPREAPINYWVTENFPSIEEVIESIKGIELNYKPGTKYHYSNLGIALLGYILEKAANQSFDSYIIEKILHPLGMDNTGFNTDGMDQSNIARFYLNSNTDNLNIYQYPYLNAFIRTGGLYSSVEDIARFISLQFEYDNKSNTILNGNSIRNMYKHQFVLEDWSGAMGIGWALNKIDGFSTIRHSGGIKGTSANITAIPRLKIGVAVLANIDTNNAVEEISYQILHAMIPHFKDLGNDMPQVIDRNVQYGGYYQFDYFPGGYAFEIQEKDDNLTAFFPNAGPLFNLPLVKLFSIDKDHFVMKNWFLPFFEDEIAVFERDKSGCICSVKLSGYSCRKLNSY